MKSPFKKALPIIEKIEEAGFEAYFVGGSVRDLLLDREIDDVDIATSATPEEIKMIFSRTVDVGIRHGTVIVVYEGETYEVTTFRSEAEYVDFRRPKEVYFIRSLKEDLQRRDFTINAIAMDKTGKLYDPFHGQADLHKRIIRTVGKAEERFHEDALRMMRALRFISQLSFTIDNETLLALQENGHLLKHIAMERIIVEFEKLLVGENYQQALEMLIKTNIINYLPGLTKQGTEDFLQLNIPGSVELLHRWALLLYHFHLSKTEIDELLRQWKMATANIKYIQAVLKWLNYRIQHDWTLETIYSAYQYVETTEKLFNLIKGKPVNEGLIPLQNELHALPIKNRKELAVTGTDLMAWYEKTGGPWIEEMLSGIERAIIYKKLTNNKEAIKEWLKTWNHQ